jgi:hypothetical protein
MKKLFLFIVLAFAISANAQFSTYQGTMTSMKAEVAQHADGDRWYNTTTLEYYNHVNNTWIPVSSEAMFFNAAAARLKVGWNFDTTKSAHVDTLPALTSVYAGDKVYLHDYLGNGATDSMRTIPLSPDSLASVPQGTGATGAINGAEIYAAYAYVVFEAVLSNNGNTSGLVWRRLR